MKNQTFRMTMLFDFYGELLTERQKEFYELYYDEDLSLSEIAENPERYIIPVDSLFSEHPAIELSAAQTAKLKCGNILNVSAKNGTYRVYGENGDFLALANISAGKLKTIKSFFEVDND